MGGRALGSVDGTLLVRQLGRGGRRRDRRVLWVDLTIRFGIGSWGGGWMELDGTGGSVGAEEVDGGGLRS